jgi:hypothetical protein
VGSGAHESKRLPITRIDIVVRSSRLVAENRLHPEVGLRTRFGLTLVTRKPLDKEKVFAVIRARAQTTLTSSITHALIPRRSRPASETPTLATRGGFCIMPLPIRDRL